MPATSQPHASGNAALLALGGFAVFSLHDAFIKSLVGYSVLQIIFFAVLFSYVPFSFYLAADKRDTNLRPVNPGWVLLRSACIAASAAFAFYAFRTLPLAQAYSLLFAMPIVVTLLAIPLLGERVGLLRWAAIGLGLSGVVIVLRPGTVAFELGHLAALLATLSSALSGVTTRKIGASERSATLILYPMLGNVLLTGALLAVVYQPMPLLDLAKMAVIGGLGMLGQLLLIFAYRSAPAAFVAPFQYSQMLWAVLYGYLWFDEYPDRFVVVGTLVIVIAGLLIVWRESLQGVSLYRPFLRTRNLRAVSAPPMKSIESDEADATKTD